MWRGYDAPRDDEIAAFSELTDLSGMMKLPGHGGVPAGQAVRMHFIVYLTRGRDFVFSIRVDPDMDEESSGEVLRIAARWPAGRATAICGPSAAFDRPVDLPETVPPATRAFSARGFRSGCVRPEARSS